MAHFAKLDNNNVVLEVNVLNNDVVDNLSFPDSEPVGIQFLTQWSGGYTNWRQTSYNNNFRYNYAGEGFVFDPTPAPYGAFIPPKLFPSWLLDTNIYQWKPPVPYPDDGNLYYWDESTQTWVGMTP
jgi:hypothetical protein